MRGCEGVDAGLHGGEAVAARGGKVLRDAEFFKEFRLKCRGFGGVGVVVEFAEERDESFDQRRIGVDAEAEAARGGINGGCEPDGGNTAGDAVGVDAVGGGKRRDLRGAGNDGSEAFLRVGDWQEGVEEALLFFGEVHFNINAVIQPQVNPTRQGHNRRWRKVCFDTEGTELRHRGHDG